MTFSLPCVYRGYPWRIAFAQIKRLKAVSARQLSVDAHNQAVFPPEYQPRVGEDIEVKRARLRYQSRYTGQLRPAPAENTADVCVCIVASKPTH